jgi:hypothetical protein
VSVVGGKGVDQDAVALAAGSKLAEGDPRRWLPPGVASRADYQEDLPVVDAAVSGTSVAGLVRAVEVLAPNALAAVAIAGPWTEHAVGAVFDIASLDPLALLLANVRTGGFAGSHPSPGALIAAAYGDCSGLPDPEWDVGHFVNPMLYVDGPNGALVLVRDTYPSIGVRAHHWQPANALSTALARGDGREGGVLVLCAPDVRAGIEQRATDAGMRVATWDNGTPD